MEGYIERVNAVSALQQCHPLRTISLQYYLATRRSSIMRSKEAKREAAEAEPRP